MSESATIETALSASRFDVHDQDNLSASCERHDICESKMRAMIDMLHSLADSFEVYVTR